MNPWKILGVNRSTSPGKIHEAYINLMKKHHPDVAKGKDRQQASIITGAYALLKDPEELKRFITQQSAIGRPCTLCKGNGVVYKQKGFNGRVGINCHPCEGSGIILKKEKTK